MPQLRRREQYQLGETERERGGLDAFYVPSEPLCSLCSAGSVVLRMSRANREKASPRLDRESHPFCPTPTSFMARARNAHLDAMLVLEGV